jgi:hypothetical protein
VIVGVNSIWPYRNGGWRLRPKQKNWKNARGAKRGKNGKKFPPRYAA